MNKTKHKQKSSYRQERDDGHKKVKQQKSLYDKKQFRELDNVLKTRNVGKILSYSDDQY